jgi:hypothetical protein
MGMIMIRCPRTGSAIPTGMQSDREQFACTPVFFASTHCPICNDDHRWFAREAWVGERGDRFATAA